MVAGRSRVAGIMALAVLLTACGSGRHSIATTSASVKTHTTTTTTPAPPPRLPAHPGAVRVIKAWSNALRRGDVRGAARYFAVPSVMINGVGPAGQLALIRIRSAADAVLANETLPCGARFVSADMRGRFVDVLFQLTGRPGPGGTDCGSGLGATARTSFVIARGRIVEWIRTPDEPGDSAAGAAPPQTTPEPSTPPPTIPEPTIPPTTPTPVA